MTEAEILNSLTTLFRDVLGDDTIELTSETSSPDVEGWDSFNHLVLMVAVEKRFGLKLRTEEIEGLQDIGDLIKIIQARATL